MEGEGRGADYRMVRSGKAEGAMSTAGRVGKFGWRRRTVGIVRAQFESWFALVGHRRQRESAECDKQGLRGDGVCQNYSYQPAPKAVWHYAKPIRPITHEA
jgi:hypothetical protein